VGSDETFFDKDFDLVSMNINIGYRDYVMARLPHTSGSTGGSQGFCRKKGDRSIF
jgi:hypothetical protein